MNETRTWRDVFEFPRGCFYSRDVIEKRFLRLMAKIDFTARGAPEAVAELNAARVAALAEVRE
jgi:hypothetical protein